MKALKKSLCVFLVVLMVYTSIPVAGFAGVDLKSLAFSAAAQEDNSFSSAEAQASPVIVDGEEDAAAPDTEDISETEAIFEPETKEYNQQESEAGSEDETEPVDPEKCGESCMWVYDEEALKLTIKGVGAISDYSQKDAPWKEIADKIEMLDIDIGITVVGASSFAGLTALKTVILPSTLTEIGENAFSGCAAIELVAYPAYEEDWAKVTVGEGNELLTKATFECYRKIDSGDCSESITWEVYNNGLLKIEGTGELADYTILDENGEIDDVKTPWMSYTDDIKKIEVSEGITSLGHGAFALCTSVTEISLPSTLESMGKAAFTACMKLRKLVIPEKVTEIGYGAFSSCSELRELVIQGDITKIDEMAFSYCTELVKIDIPDSLEEIGQMAFLGCSMLEKIEIPSGVKNIPYGAFAYCEVLENVTFNEGLETVSELSFYYAGISEAEFPTTLKSIKDNAFYGSVNLESITLPEGITELGHNAFAHCTALNSVVIPGSLEVIGSDAFTGCEKIMGIVINEGVKEIGTGAFFGCKSATTALIADTVEKIGIQAFSGCTELSRVALPAALTEICENAFVNCTSLENVTFNAEKAKWDAVTVAAGNECLTDKNIVFTDSEQQGETFSGDFAEGLIWEYNTATKTLKITGEGAIPSYAEEGFAEVYAKALNAVAAGKTDGSEEAEVKDITAEAAPWREYEKQAETLIIGEGITAIGDYTFAYCSNLLNVSFPSTLKSIGEACFLFSGDVKEIIYPEGLKTIGDNVFFISRFVTKYYLPSTLENYKFTARIWRNCEIICNADCETDIGFVTDMLSLIGNEEGEIFTVLIYLFLNESVKSTAGFYGEPLPEEELLPILEKKFEQHTGVRFPIDESIMFMLMLIAILMMSPVLQHATEALTLRIPENSGVHKYAKENFILHYVGDSEQPCDCFECEGKLTDTITYSLNKETGLLTFDGTGDFPADIKNPNEYPYNKATRLIKNVAFTEDSAITSIGNYAFYNFVTDEIVIPDTVTSIGAYAYCRSGNGEQYDIGENITYIGNGAFQSSAVKSFTIANEECVLAGSGIFPDTATLKGSYNSLAEIYAGQNNLNFETEEYTPEDHFAYEENEDGTVTVTGFKIITKYVRMPETLGGKKVTAIKDNAFYYHSLISLELPDTITYIGEKAFYYSNVKTLKLPKNVETIGDYAFYSADITDDLELPHKLRTIGYEAFAFCDGIKKISIPDSVESVGGYAFEAITLLEEVYIGSGVRTGLETAFTNCCPKKYTVSYDNESYRSELGVLYNKDMTVLIAYPGKKAAYSFVVPETVTEINAGAFFTNYGLSYDYSKLQYIELNDNIKHIKESTFSGCSKLREINLSSSLETIADGAFEKCVSLESITIPDSVKKISGGAFRGCSKLSDVYIGSGLETITYSTFGTQDLYATHKSVKNFYVSENNPNYTAIDGVLFSKDKTVLISYPTENERTTYYIPEGTQTIEERAFMNSDKLTKVVMNDTVTTLDASVFSRCSALKEVEFSRNVTHIPAYTFNDCDALTEITIPDNITSIATYAFINCNNLKDVTVGSAAQGLSSSTFITSDNSYESDSDDYRTIANCYVSENNPNYSDENGVLFNKDKTELIACFCENERTEYEIPSTVKTIGASAFRGCEKLTQVRIPEGVERIGSSAFYNCLNISSFSFPDSLTEVGSSVFYGCSSVETFSIGSGLTSISGMPLAKEYIISEDNPALLSEDGVFFNKNKTKLVVYPAKNERTEYSIPDTVTEIGNSAFRSDKNLKSLTIPASVRTIGGYAFCEMKSIESLVVPVGVTTINDYTFAVSPKLTSVTIPETVTNISSYAFYSHNSELTIYGVMDSAAHRYAQNYGINFVDRSSGATLKVLYPSGTATDIANYTVKWYDGDGNYVATGSRLYGAVNGREYYYEIILNEWMSYRYKAPEKVKIVHNIESPDYTYTLEEIPSTVLKGTVTDKEGNAIDNVRVDITQIFASEYENKQYCYTNEKGEFTFTCMQVPTIVTYTATGYYKKSTEVLEFEELTDASVTLRELPNNKITLSLKEVSAAEEGQEPTETELSNANGLRFTLYNEYKEEYVSDFELQYPTIYIGEGQVASYDRLIIKAIDNNGERKAEPVYVDLDENCTGNAEITLKRNGSFTADVKAHKRTLAIIFDEDGNRVHKSTFSSSDYGSPALADGTYTVVFINYSTYISGISKLSNLVRMGLTENTDYIKKSVTVEAGKIVSLGEITVPVFDESQFYFTEKNSTRVSANTTSAVAGKYITVKAEYKIGGQYETSDEVMKIQFPEGISPVEGSVTVDSKVRPYTYNEEERAIYVTVNKPQATVRFYCVGATEGEHSVDALLSFDYDGEEILQPIGSAAIKLVNSTISLLEQTKDKNVYVSGSTVPGAKVEIYSDGELAGTVTANKVGSWVSEIELQNTYNYSYHDIYAVITSDRFDAKINTDTKTVLYNKAHVQATKLTMYVPYLFGSVVEFDLVKPSTPDSYNIESYPAKFTFTAEFDGDEKRAKDVYVVAGLETGEYRKIPMAYDKYKNIWVAYAELDPGIGEAVLGANLVYDYDMPEDFEYNYEYALDAVESDHKKMFEALDEELLYDVSIGEVSEDYVVIENTDVNNPDNKFNYFVTEFDYSKFDVNSIEEEFILLDSEDQDEETSVYLAVYNDDEIFAYVFVDTKNESAWSIYMPSLAKFEEQNEETVNIATYDYETAYENKYGSNDIDNLWTAIDLLYDVIKKDIEKFEEIEKGNAESFEWTWEDTRDLLPFVNESYAAGELQNLNAERDRKIKTVKSKFAQVEKALDYRCENGEYALTDSERANFASAYYSFMTIFEDTTISINEQLSRYAARILGATGLSFAQWAVSLYKAVKAVIKILGSRFMGFRNFLLSKIGWLGYAHLFRFIDFAKNKLFNKMIDDIKERYEELFGLDAKNLYREMKRYDKIESDLEELLMKISSSYSCEPKEEEDPLITLLICYIILDPSGYVYEAVPSNRVEGVKAEAYYYDYPLDEFGVPMEDKELILWDAENYDQVNPLYTDADGRYAWDVPAGQWLVKYSKDGYYDTDSSGDIACDEDGFLPVPPPQTEVNTAIVSKAAPTVKSINTYEDSVQIIFSQYMQIDTVNTDNVKITVNGEAVTGTITASNAEYDYEGVNEYASVFTFTPEEKLSGTASVTVENVVNYAGKEIESAHNVNKPVTVRPEGITAPENVKITYGSGSLAELTVYPAEAGVKKNLTVTSSNENSVKVLTKNVTTDENGKASITIQGELPGDSTITVTIDGTDISTKFTAEVSNIDEGAGKCETVKSSLPNGSRVPAGTTFTLSTETEGAEIYYTLDGTCPCILGSPSRILYEGPITVNEDTFIIAYAVKEGHEDSATAGFVYTVETQCTHTSLSYKEEVPAKCTVSGTRGYYECESCSKKFSDSSASEEITDILIPATGHKGGKATCKAQAKCSVCGMSYGSVNKKNHASLTTLKAVAATCEKTGLTAGKKCTACGEITVKQNETSLAKHKEVTVKGKAATYVSDGLTDGKKCSVCGEITVAQKAVARKKLSKVTGLKTKAVKLASGTKTTLTLTWAKAEGAQSYEVQQYSGGKWKTVGTTTANTLTVKKLKAKKTYKFRVRAIAGKYNGDYSSSYSAKTVPLKTTLKVTAGKKKLTASWSAVSNITKYEIQYSTSKKFKKKTTKTTKSRKLTVKKLKKGKKYYVRVRAYKTVGGKKIYSSWSSVKSVKVK